MPLTRPLARAALLPLLLAALHGPALAADTPIFAIQGSGAASPLAGQTVTTTGVVTKVHANGFFLQDLQGDGDPATSDGIFVFTSSAPAVAVGQYLRLSGRVTEFNTGAAGNADTLAHPVTELTHVSGLTVLGTGYAIAPTPVALPAAGHDDLERVEGMLVTLRGPLTVSQNYFQARYGQLTLSAGGRLETPTNRHRPGSAQAVALADANARRRILLDDGRTAQNPNPTPFLGGHGLPRGGDTVGDVTGVVDYGLATASAAGLGDYKIHPTVAPLFSATHPRSAAPEAVGGNLKLASFNVLNYFTTFGNGQTADGLTGQGCALGGVVSASNCRGAGHLAEFLRQRAKIVEALAAIDADAVGLMEMQNNGGTAVQNLVDALNARVGAGTWAAVPDPAAGTGSDAITVAMIHRPARLQRVGAAVSDLNAVNNRPTLAQTFAAANGERFTLVVNHFKSKGSCPAPGDADYAGNHDLGDGQGCWNARRVQQARQLRSFVAQLQAASGSHDVLLIGDLNAYAQEDPVTELTDNGYVDQIGRFSRFGYSYVFDGAAGRLDHGIASATLSPKVARALEWHINADEQPAHDYNLEFKQPACASCAPDPYAPTPYRSADHDPVVLGLNLYNRYITASGAAVLGTAGDDLITVGALRPTLTGGAGRDQFAFGAGFTGGATITDFTPGADLINLRAVLQAAGITAPAPLASGHLGCTRSGAGDALLSLDPDAGGPAPRRPLLLLKRVGCAALGSASFQF